MKRTLCWYIDPAHGWLAVPLTELTELGINKNISTFSYVQGDTAYLEEDRDAGVYIEALTAKHPDIELEHYVASDSASFIRNFTSYRV